MTRPGHTYDTPFVGLTLPEQGLGEKAVHLRSSHYLTIASTGAGKLLTSAAHQLIGWPHDLVAITPKEDLCNLSLGRRADPEMFSDLTYLRRMGRRAGILTAEQVARMLQVSPRQVWRLVSSAKMVEPVHLGGNTRWRREEVESWIASGCPEPTPRDNPRRR